MKKFVLCLTAVLFAAGTAHAEYVRKRIRPNFFIPARELERAEKLPPFPEPGGRTGTTAKKFTTLFRHKRRHRPPEKLPPSSSTTKRRRKKCMSTSCKPS